MNDENEFELTEEHLALLRKMYVGWCGDEYGAPEINPKRPYGNSDVAGDIIEILEWVDGDLDEDDEEEFFESEEYEILCKRAELIHSQTQIALQIILIMGKFEAGNYVRDDSWSEWKLKE